MKAKGEVRLSRGQGRARECGSRVGDREGAGGGCAPSDFSGGAGKAEQWKGESALGKSEIRRFQKKS